MGPSTPPTVFEHWWCLRPLSHQGRIIIIFLTVIFKNDFEVFYFFVAAQPHWVHVSDRGAEAGGKGGREERFRCKLQITWFSKKIINFLI